jgi:hypothetical protein
MNSMENSAFGKNMQRKGFTLVCHYSDINNSMRILYRIPGFPRVPDARKLS